MKQSSIFFILFFLVCIEVSSFAQQKKQLSFDADWKITNIKSLIVYSCETYVLKNGALDGPFTCYKKDSDVIVKKYLFSNNILHGEVFEYFDNGTLKLSAQYDKGTPVRNWQEWNLAGELVVDKTFDGKGKFTLEENKKELSEYEKLYFGTKAFEEPVYNTDCILIKIDDLKKKCSDTALFDYYNTPPIPPSYRSDAAFSGKTVQVKLEYLLSEKGRVDSVYILESSGDLFLDDLAETHILNMMPFEAAKEYENPIKYWIEAVLFFSF